jgi:hypothetical protein
MGKLQVLLTLSVILLILVVLAFRFRKALSLYLIKAVYGKYSYEYLSTFKRLFIRSPFQYCFRDEFIAHVLFVLDIKDEVPVYKTSRQINFENLPFFTDYKEFLKINGDPDCFNAFSFSNPDFIIKVAGYQEIIGGQKGTAVYYFIDDLFFMGEYIFKRDKAMVMQECIRPYVDPTRISADNFYIINTQDRIVHYQDTGFSVDIKYLSREDRRILETLKSYHDEMTSKKLKMED